MRWFSPSAMPTAARARRPSRHRPEAWWALSLPLLAFLVIFVRSLTLTVIRRRVPWKGRQVPLGA